MGQECKIVPLRDRGQMEARLEAITSLRDFQTLRSFLLQCAGTKRSGIGVAMLIALALSRHNDEVLDKELTQNATRIVYAHSDELIDALTDDAEIATEAREIVAEVKIKLGV